jgi:hypothetical protein
MQFRAVLILFAVSHRKYSEQHRRLRDETSNDRKPPINGVWPARQVGGWRYLEITLFSGITDDHSIASPKDGGRCLPVLTTAEPECRPIQCDTYNRGYLSWNCST